MIELLNELLDVVIYLGKTLPEEYRNKINIYLRKDSPILKELISKVPNLFNIEEEYPIFYDYNSFEIIFHLISEKGNMKDKDYDLIKIGANGHYVNLTYNK